LLAVGGVLALASLAMPARAMASPIATPTAAQVGTDQAPTNSPDSGGYSNGSGGTGAGVLSATSPDAPQSPATPTGTGTSSGSGGTISVNLGGTVNKPSESITIIIALTLLAVAPSLLILLTSFTRIIIVLSITRQALGLTNVPPNQLLAGLALVSAVSTIWLNFERPVTRPGQLAGVPAE